MRVLVTGANGHVGANLVRELLGREHEVVPFVRKTSNLDGLAGLELEYVYGDVLDGESVVTAAAGCDAIIHLAAVFALRGKSAADIMEPAVRGVRHVLEAASKHGVRRVVHTSSVVSLGYDRDPERVRTEDEPVEGSTLPYFRAKRESEAEAWRVADELDVPLVVLNPGGILGRYDTAITPSMFYLLQLLDGRGMTGPGSANYVDVRDVAWAHAEALEKAEPGERYIIGGDNVSLQAFGELVAELADVKVRHMNVPRWLGLPGMAVQNFFTRMFGGTPAITLREGRAFAARHGRFDSSKAQRAFGYQPRSLREAMTDATRWLVFRRALRPKTLEHLAARFEPDPDWK